MIEIQKISLNFDGQQVLDEVSLTVPEGRAFGLLGSNGAGKSTLLHVLSGIYKPDSGTVRIDGDNVWDNVKTKEKICFVNDETIQFSAMTLLKLKNDYKRFYATFSE